jgi:hypothetical protein
MHELHVIHSHIALHKRRVASQYGNTAIDWNIFLISPVRTVWHPFRNEVPSGFDPAMKIRATHSSSQRKPDGTGDPPPPKSPVVTNDAHRTSSPGGRYFFAPQKEDFPDGHAKMPIVYPVIIMVNRFVMRQLHRWHTE